MENNNRQGCRWTKASERLQGDDQDVIVKWRINEEVWCADHCTGKDLKEQMKHSGHEYFWLDESIEPCATSSRIEELEEWIRQVDKSLYIGEDLQEEDILKWYIDVVTVIKDEAKEILKSQTPSPTGDDRDCEELKKEAIAFKNFLSKNGLIVETTLKNDDEMWDYFVRNIV